MDSTIQSLTQSAIVQKLSEKEHLIKRFLHDIPDNAPYRSEHKVELNGVRDDPNVTDSLVTFNVPRNGFLNRMWLKVRVHFDKVHTQFLTLANQRHAWGPEKFGMVFEYCQLKIGDQVVETLLPESVMYNSFRHKGAVSLNVLKGLTGHDYKVENSDSFNDFAIAPERDNVVTSLAGVDFLIPLEFSVLRHLKDSLDTNFLPKMTLLFKRKTVLGYQSLGPTGSTQSKLVCKYHNFHNHFRANIRNANFGVESPILYLNDSTQVTKPPVYTPLEGDVGRFKFSIDLDLEITEILIAFRNLHPDHVNDDDYKSEFVPGHNEIQNLSFRLKANGKTLLLKYGSELVREDFALSGVDLQDKVDVSAGLTLFQSLRRAQNWHSDPLRDYVEDSAVQAYRYHRRSSSLYIIPMTLLGTDLFYNGSMSTKSLSNVSLEIEGESLFIDEPSSATTFANFLPSVVLRHKKLLRIDSKTGVVG
jgi:hypothetical protein